jgi:hypothetical protein
MDLPVNSPRSEVTPSIRSLISTRSVRLGLIYSLGGEIGLAPTQTIDAEVAAPSPGDSKLLRLVPST